MTASPMWVRRGRNAADRSDMFGIERMLHCKQIANFIVPNIEAKG